MAKGLRSSVKKANRARLRSQVFGPVENARKERLSAKLLETAGQPSASTRDESIIQDDSVNPPVRSDTSSAHFDVSTNAKSTETASEGMETVPSDDALNQATSMDLEPSSKPLSSTQKHHSRTRKPRNTRRGKEQSALVFRVSRKRKGSGIRKRQTL
ncbi:MAG: hypothetical protein Q9223_003383 [Gallowayella weberi]